jgi:hemerythrin-like metal-binding protein
MTSENRELIHWIPGFETGHPELDAQHREIIEKVNEIVISGAPCGALATRACQELPKLIENHGLAEDKVLAEIGYADAGQHSQTHTDMFNQACKISKDCNKSCVAQATATCVPDWINIVLDHFLREDLLFKSLLQERLDGR